MRRKIPNILTAEQITKLIAQPNKRVPTGLRNKAMLSFIFDNGARVSDIINLRPGDLNLTKREVIIKEGKGGIDRNLSFSEGTGELLKKYKNDRPKGEYFFCTIKGGKLNRIYIWQMIGRYARRIGIKKNIGCHTLRHSFAVKFYQDSNHDLIRLQKILGHRSLATTQIYCYIDPTDVKEGLEKYYNKRDGSKENNIKEKVKNLEEAIEKLKSEIEGI
jgi:site-specific recombinase XerD